MMCLFSKLDVTGNLPVWSVYILPCKYVTVMYVSCVLVLLSYDMNSITSSIILCTSYGFVLFLFLNYCFKCPFTTYSGLGKYFVTSFAVRPGHVAK